MQEVRLRRLLVNLDDETYDALRRLAFKKNVPMARLVRQAIEETYEDDIDGILSDVFLAEHLADPSGSITIEEYMESRGIAIPRRRSQKSAARARRAAS